MEQNKKALKFPYMILGGLLISVFLGSILDYHFNTLPLITLALILYTVIGSFILLIKGDKRESDSKVDQ